MIIFFKGVLLSDLNSEKYITGHRNGYFKFK